MEICPIHLYFSMVEKVIAMAAKFIVQFRPGTIDFAG
jgi:hypothetical protein